MPTPEQLAAQAKKIVQRSQRQLFLVQIADEAKLRRLYRDSLKKVNAKILMLKDFPKHLERIQDDLEKEIARLSKRATTVIEGSNKSAIKLGIHSSVDSMILYKKGFPTNFKVRLDSEAFSRVFTQAVRAASVPIENISLSGRVWDINRIALEDLNRHLARAMAQGRSMSEITQEIRRFLIFPDADLRKKKWRLFIKQNPPGRGVYRSASKNLQRVLRTESNRAFRLGAAEYAKEKKWVKGVKWNLSPGHPEPDVCDELSHSNYYGLGEGIFTADSVPDSPHPHCICFTTMVVKDKYLPK